MANLRAIRTRIKSVESTRQITKSMKMVAAAKLRKTQTAYESLRRFAQAAEGMLPAAAGKSDDPLLSERAEIRRRCYVLILGNRGLCGTYHTSLLHFAQERMEPGSLLVSCGRWGKDQIGPTERTFSVSDDPNAAEARELADYLKELYLCGRVDEVILMYQSFRSVLQQEPVCLRLLPMCPPQRQELSPLFEPDRAAVLEGLLDLSLLARVHAALLEARTGEHAARMTAMTAAADNTEELIAELTLALNHARQAAITTEITEIVGGAAAL